MAIATQIAFSSVVSLWRYPVKSMMGEELNGILRTAAQHNQVNVGIYAAVLRGGTIRRGDPVRVE